MTAYVERTSDQLREMTDEELITERGDLSATMAEEKATVDPVRRGRQAAYLVRLESELSRRKVPEVRVLVRMNGHMLTALDVAADFMRAELDNDPDVERVLIVLDQARQKAREHPEVQAAAERFAAEKTVNPATAH